MLLAALAGGLVGHRLAPGAPQPGVVHSMLDLRPAEALLGPHALERTAGMGRPSRTAIALSTDGRRLAFVGREGERQRLYLRGLDEIDAHPLSGTDGADNPFFSPDGTAVGFWSGGAIRRVAVDGGPPVAVCPSAPLAGAVWPASDDIVFATTTGGLMRVAAGGGRPEPLTRLAPGEVSHRLPHAVPGGALLFTVFESGFDKRRGRVEVLERATGRRLSLAENAADARYVRSGHVVFARRGTLVAVPFDRTALRARGSEVGVVDDVMQSLNIPYVDVETGAAQFDVAEDECRKLPYDPCALAVELLHNTLIRGFLTIGGEFVGQEFVQLAGGQSLHLHVIQKGVGDSSPAVHGHGGGRHFVARVRADLKNIACADSIFGNSGHRFKDAVFFHLAHAGQGLKVLLGLHTWSLPHGPEEWPLDSPAFPG